MAVSSKKITQLEVTSGNPDLACLVRLIQTYAPYDGSFETKIPGVHAIRRSKVDREMGKGLAHSGFCIIAQGAKTLLLGRDLIRYDASKMVVYSVDVPVSFQVTRASAAEPFLGLRLDLDPARIADLTLKVYPHGLPPVRNPRAIYTGVSNPQILAATVRLLELIPQTEERAFLAPLVMDEILIRLLKSPMGPRVAQLGLKGSGLNGVAQAITWLKQNFAQSMKVDALARLANMSVSTFHMHFKAVTSMSPLQYQKVLRLQEARRLMLSAMMDAGIASRQVGYLSASQFSREYGRFFGGSPTQDIAKLREQTVNISEA